MTLDWLSIFPYFAIGGVVQSQKHAFVPTKPSQEKWHSHLDHPSFTIVSKIISNNKIILLEILA
jgi:Ni/Fe-hydrogenase subunit HybB-like protein